MPSSSGNDYVGATGPDGFKVWRPTPFPYNSSQSQPTQSQDKTGPGGNNSGGGTSPGTGTGTGSGNGQVQAQALFLTAACQSTDTVGSFVRADTGSNNVTTVTCFQPYPSIGCIISKSSATQCVVQTYGLNSAFTGLQPNSRYFVGPQGQPVLAAQLPGNAPYVQPIGFAVQSQQLFIQPSGTLYRRDTSSPSTPESGSGDTVSGYYGGLLNGEGAPAASLGNQNDSYLETDGQQSVALWGPKPSATDWGNTRVSLVGAAGAPGNRFYISEGPPDGSVVPNVNDIWFQLNQNEAIAYPAA